MVKIITEGFTTKESLKLIQSSNKFSSLEEKNEKDVLRLKNRGIIFFGIPYGF